MRKLGIGANLFDVQIFNADFAYTMDGGRSGNRNTKVLMLFSNCNIQVKNVHPWKAAKDTMVNALKIALDFLMLLVPQMTFLKKNKWQRRFFSHLLGMTGEVEEARMELYYSVIMTVLILKNVKPSFKQRPQRINWTTRSWTAFLLS